jgi:MFS family permease
MLVVLAALSYLVGNMATPAYNAILRNNYPGTHRYRAFSIVVTTISAVAFLTSLGVGWLLTNYDERLFRVVFPIGAACGIVAILVYSRIKVRGERGLEPLDDADAKPFSFSGKFGILWRDRRFGKFMLMQFLLGFSNLLTAAVLVSLIKQQDASYLEASLVLSVAPNAAMVMTMPMWGRILQNMSPWRARSILAMIWAVGIVLIGCSGQSILMVILGQAIIGTSAAGGSLMWSLQQMYFARKEDVPQYMGVHCTLTGIRGLTAPFLGVWLMSLWGAHAVFFVAAAGMLTAEGIALQMVRREQRAGGARGHADADEQQAGKSL